MRDKGFVKLHRKFTEWEWYSDSNTMRVFLHLLLTASHKASKYRGHVVPIGSVVTGYDALSAQLSLSVQKVRTAIKHLKSTGEVTVQITNNFSLLTLIKWEDYQDRGKINTSHLTVNQQATNKQLTSNQQATNNQLTVSKERKKGRKEEEETIAQIFGDSFCKFWEAYPKRKDRAKAMLVWMRIRPDDILVQKILNAVRSNARTDDWKKQGGQYIPLAATWLNGKRWEDELAVVDSNTFVERFL